MAYIHSVYPSNIPKHNGQSKLGCEKAILWLDGLNKEISKALRLDKDDVLDIDDLESLRVSIMKDIVALKNHIKKIDIN
jgi:hypothetical protein